MLAALSADYTLSLASPTTAGIFWRFHGVHHADLAHGRHDRVALHPEESPFRRACDRSGSAPRRRPFTLTLFETLVTLAAHSTTPTSACRWD